MSLNPLQTNITGSKPLFAPIGSAGGGISTFSTLTASTIQIGTGSFSSIQGMQLIADTAHISSISTSTLYANDISTAVAFIHDAECSTIVAQTLQLDAQTLTANSAALLLNGIPIATTANLSTLADWSFDPAISTVQMDNNDIRNWRNATGSTLTVSSIQGGSLAVSSIFANSIGANDISTNTLTVISTIHAISSISSAVIYVDEIDASTVRVSDNISVPQLAVSSVIGNSGSYSTVSVSSIFGRAASYSTVAVSSLVGVAASYSTVAVSSLTGVAAS